MPKFKVNPADVAGAGTQVQQAGATIREAVGYLGSGQVSDPGFQTAEAVARFCSSWSTGLTAFAQACDSVSARLTKTSTVYEVTELHLSGEFGGS